MRSILEIYVVGAGWVMLLLLPGLVVALATALRCAWMYRVRAMVGEGDTAQSRTMERLRTLAERHGTVTAADVREETLAEVLDLYSLLMPLHLIFVAAPLAGLLGTLTALLPVIAEPARGAGLEWLAPRVYQSLLASFWGTGVGLFAFVLFFFLRSRLAYMEREALAPAVGSAAESLVAPKSPFRASSRRGDSSVRAVE